MIHGSWIDAVVASGQTTSSEVDLVRPYETLLVVIPTLDSTTQVTIEVAEKTSGTFQEVYATDPADGGDNKLITAATSGGTTWVAPIGGFQFIKIKCDNSQSVERTFRVCGVRS